MAERLKKNNAAAAGINRPVSIDENVNNIILSSTNDSRI